MFASRQRPEYELVGRSSSDDDGLYIPHEYRVKSKRSWLSYARFKLRTVTRSRRTIFRIISVFVYVIAILVVLTPIFNPSYSTRPSHYTASNPQREKVFIAANIVNAKLISGAWGKNVRALIEIIGRENTFLSIYENDSGEETKKALQDFASSLRSMLPPSHFELC
jgi:hypothetical protein